MRDTLRGRLQRDARVTLEAQGALQGAPREGVCVVAGHSCPRAASFFDASYSLVGIPHMVYIARLANRQESLLAIAPCQTDSQLRALHLYTTTSWAR